MLECGVALELLVLHLEDGVALLAVARSNGDLLVGKEQNGDGHGIEARGRGLVHEELHGCLSRARQAYRVFPLRRCEETTRKFLRVPHHVQH